MFSPITSPLRPKKLYIVVQRPRTWQTTVSNTLECMNSMPGRPILFTIMLILANFQGHYLPILWSRTTRPALLAQGQWFLQTQQQRRNQRLPGDSLVPFQEPVPLRSGADLFDDDGGHAFSGAVEGTGIAEARDETGDSLGAEGRPSDGGAPEHHQRLSSVFREAREERSLVEAAKQDEAAAKGTSTGRESDGAAAAEDDDGEAEGDRITPYVAHHRIDVAGSPVCQGIVPPHVLSNVNRSPIKDLATLDEANRRALVFMARYGLGNSLRGYVSAFVYAKVSGRTLVRFHGAEHTKVYDTLCTAFRCGFDSIRWSNQTSPMELYRELDQLNPYPMFKTSKGVRDSIPDDVPVMICRSPSLFDGFWRNYPRILSCIHTAFACSSPWCVHSRAIHGLLRSPTPILKDVIRTVLHKYVPPPFPEPGGASGTASTAQGKEVLAIRPGDAGPARGVDTMFDVALHMRTRTAAIESLEGGDAELSRVGCTDRTLKGARPEKAPHQFLKSCLWGCIGSLIGEIARNRQQYWDAQRRAGKGLRRPAPRLSILLTTDNEALRPVFVRRLSALGDVFFSKGGIVHLSKSAGSDVERLPTMAEFFLMAKSHTIIEAGSYISTFAYFAGLYGNGTLASIEWYQGGGCGLKISHRGEVAHGFSAD